MPPETAAHPTPSSSTRPSDPAYDAPVSPFRRRLTPEQAKADREAERHARTPPTPERVEAQRAIRRQCDIAADLRRCGVPDRYRAASLDAASPSADLADRSDSGAAAIALRRGWAAAAEALRDSLEQPGVLVLHGPRGTGKTWLACGLLNAAVASGLTGRYASLPDLLMAAKREFGGDGRAGDAERQLVPPQVVVIDEAHERSHGEWDSRLLTTLVDRRYVRERTTVLITNAGAARADALEEEHEDAVFASLGPSIADRVADVGGRMIPCRWPSLRGRLVGSTGVGASIR